MQIPDNINRLNQELYALCNSGNQILVKDAAKLCGVSDDVLRQSIWQGKCPFGIGGDNGKYSNRFTKIPTLAFFNFMTQCALYKQQYEGKSHENC